MPKVPQLEEQGTIAALPGARVSAAPTPATFGAGVGQAVESTGVAVYTRAVREEDEAAVQHADLQLAKAQTDLQLEVEALRGKEALGGTELVEKKWASHMAEASKSLSTDRQRKAVAGHGQTRYLQLNQFSLQHGFKEHEAYKDNDFAAYLKTSLDNARLQAPIDNALFPGGAVDTEKQRQKDAIDAYALRKGIAGSAQHKQKLEMMESATNAEVITGLLYNGKDMVAKQYYEDHKASFTAEDRDKVEKVVKEGSYRGESRRQVDEWVTAGKDEKAMLEATRAIKDPILADQVETRVAHHWQQQDALKKRDDDVRYQTLAQKVGQAPPGQLLRDTIGEDEYLKLTPSLLSTLESSRQERMRPEDRKNDDAKWLDFLDLNATQLAGMTRSDFDSKYRVRFDNAHRSLAETRWDAAREAAVKPTDQKFTKMVSDTEMIKTSFKRSGLIDPNKKVGSYSEEEANLAALYEREAQAAVTAYERAKYGGKQHATPDEIQGVLNEVTDRAISKVRTERPFLFGTKEHLAFQMIEVENGRDVVPLSKIPKADMDDIRSAIVKQGRPVTSSKLKRAYAQSLLRNRRAFDAIIAE